MTRTPVRKLVVTGGAGFIGSHLVDSLLLGMPNATVSVIDNFSSGREDHIVMHNTDSRFRLLRANLLDLEAISDEFVNADIVYHLAANPDARWGIENTRLDLEQETLVTYNVLEAMRRTTCRKIVLASSGTVYGDVGTSAVNERSGPTLPISLYGAGKVASEALVSAFCGTFGFSGLIFRFGNVVGERTTHGVIFDFIRKLGVNIDTLEVLGNGKQTKPYLYVRDLVSILTGAQQLGTFEAMGRCDLFNVAPADASSVRFIAETLVEALGLTDVTNIKFGLEPMGWPGDVPQSRMDPSKLESAMGVRLRKSDEAVQIAIRSIIDWIATRKDKNDGLAWAAPR